MIGKCRIEPLYQRLYLPVPDLENVQVGLIVAFARPPAAMILRHGNHYLASIDHDLMRLAKGDVFGVYATKDMGRYLLKKTSFSLVNAGEHVFLRWADQAKFVSDHGIQSRCIASADRLIKLVHNFAHRYFLF